MLKILLFTLFFYLVSTSGFSQGETNWLNYPNLGIMHYSVILDDNSTENNTYQNSQFEASKLITTENIELNSILVRYNVKKDVMECKIRSQHSVIKSPEKLQEININGKYFEYKKYLVKKDTVGGYLQRLYVGSQKIYAKHYFFSTKESAGKPELKAYYLVQNKEELPTKLNSINKLLSRFLENNQLCLNNTNDLEKILNYLNHLSKDIVSER